jgi:O-antigen ligase/tetratricopeptide (TPR) repeat protein
MSLRDFLRFIVIAGLFLTPFLCLIVADTMFFPFITGKNFTFRVIIEVILGAWAVLMFIDTAYRPKFSYILGAAAAFLGIIALADFLGVNPYRSFWSNYERMEGLVTQAHLFLYFIIAASVLATEQLWTWFWRTSLAASVIIGVYGMAQVMGKAEIHQSDARIDATLGNATYLAIYAMFHVFIAMFLWFRERREGRSSGFRWVYLATATLNVAVMYFTQTRGAILGLVGGAFLAFLLVAIFDKEHPKFRRYAWGGVIGVLLLVGAFFALRDTAIVKGSYTLSRLSAISLTDLTTSSRFTIWHMSWEGFKERPILGWGQDNFPYVFSKYYDPVMWNQEPWFDRSHNVFFDWLIAGGLLGLLAYLALFASSIITIWTLGRRHFSVIERSVLTGMLAGYFFHNLFVFDNLISYVLFFGVLAYMHTLSVGGASAALDAEKASAHKSSLNQKKKKRDEEWEVGDLALVAGLVAVGVSAMVYYVNIRNIEANRDLINALRTPVTQGPNNTPIIALEGVLNRPLFGRSEAREQMGQLAFQALDPRADANLRNKIYDLAAKNFEDEVSNDPNNLRYRSFLASLYSRYGKYPEAEVQFAKALELSPKRQAVYLEQGTMYLSLGKIDEATKAFKMAYDLGAQPDGRIYYGIALIYGKHFDEADNVFAPLKGTPQAFDGRIINAYGTNKRYDKVVELVNEKIAQGQAVGRDYFSLAGAYAELGDNKKTKEMIEKAIELDPSLKDQGEQFLEQLK